MKPVICEKKTYTVQEIMKILGIGKNAAYQLVEQKYFKSVRTGGKINGNYYKTKKSIFRYLLQTR